MLEGSHLRRGWSDAISMSCEAQHFTVVQLRPKLKILLFIQCVISECGISLVSSGNHFRNSHTSNRNITMHDHKNKNYLITNYNTDIMQTAVLVNIIQKISA
jgi:hypothetical protein